MVCASDTKLLFEKNGNKTGKWVDVLNLHIDQAEIADLGKEMGMYQTYHMNPDTWKTIPLDGTVHTRRLKILIEKSYLSTAPDDIREKTRCATLD